MAYGVKILWAGVSLLLAALMLLMVVGRAESQATGAAETGTNTSKPSGVAPTSVQTEVGEIAEVSPESLPGSNGVTALASEECHRQRVTMAYEDAPDKIYLKFTGVKFWCYDGQKVTRAGMNVEPWIRPDLRYGPGQDGYRYVGSGLKRSDRFLTYNRHRNGAHESIRVGRFEYRVHGFSRAAQVINPYVSRPGRYNGACDGPRPKDASPKVSAVKPAGGAKGVSPSANVEAVFSKGMRAGTVNGGTFYLAKKGSGADVRAKIRYDAARRKAVLNPARNLSAGTYTATVFSGPFGAMTAEGDPLVANKVWSFTVTR